jgi:hypothetical protein
MPGRSTQPSDAGGAALTSAGGRRGASTRPPHRLHAATRGDDTGACRDRRAVATHSKSMGRRRSRRARAAADRAGVRATGRLAPRVLHAAGQHAVVNGRPCAQGPARSTAEGGRFLGQPAGQSAGSVAVQASRYGQPSRSSRQCAPRLCRQGALAAIVARAGGGCQAVSQTRGERAARTKSACGSTQAQIGPHITTRRATARGCPQRRDRRRAGCAT